MVSENNTQKVTLIEKAEKENTRTETYLQIDVGCGGEMGRQGEAKAEGSGVQGLLWPCSWLQKPKPNPKPNPN